LFLLLTYKYNAFFSNRALLLIKKRKNRSIIVINELRLLPWIIFSCCNVKTIVSGKKIKPELRYLISNATPARGVLVKFT